MSVSNAPTGSKRIVVDEPVEIVVRAPVKITTGQAPHPVSWRVWLGVWGWGTVLAAGLLGILFVSTEAASCIDPVAATKDKIAFGQCSPWVQRWYLVLRDWETGIGAAIGLLGVAWSTFFKSATSSKD